MTHSLPLCYYTSTALYEYCAPLTVLWYAALYGTEQRRVDGDPSTVYNADRVDNAGPICVLSFPFFSPRVNIISGLYTGPAYPVDETGTGDDLERGQEFIHFIRGLPLPAIVIPFLVW